MNPTNGTSRLSSRFSLSRVPSVVCLVFHPTPYTRYSSFLLSLDTLHSYKTKVQ